MKLVSILTFCRDTVSSESSLGFALITFAPSQLTAKDHKLRSLENTVADREAELKRTEEKYIQTADHAEKVRAELREEIRRLSDRNDELERRVGGLNKDRIDGQHGAESMQNQNQRLRVQLALADRKCHAAKDKVGKLLEQEQKSIKIKADLR